MDEGAEIRAIERLKARYFRFMDTRDWAGWRTVFTDDVVVEVDLSAPAEGRAAVTSYYPQGGDAFVARMAPYLQGVVTVHHGHMPEIALTGPDEAEGIWAMEDHVRWPDGREMHGYGHYHERYRREGGEWRIARLVIRRLRVDHLGDWSRPEAGGASDDVPFALEGH